MANRAQRRQAMREETKKNQKLVAEYNQQKLYVRLIQNGITPETVRQEYERGRREGYKEAAEPMMKTCLAAICLALHDQYGFGQKRCYRAARATFERMITALNHQELVDEVLERIGLRMQMDEPLEPVGMTERKKAARAK